jgi:predicted Zn-dependent protease with MMP-like domain
MGCHGGKRYSCDDAVIVVVVVGIQMDKIEMDKDRFEQLVAEAVEALPRSFRRSWRI